MLQHFINKYEIITSVDLTENTKELIAPWNIEQPIQKLWERIKECQRLGKAGDKMITNHMAIFTAVKVLDETGLFGTYTTN